MKRQMNKAALLSTVAMAFVAPTSVMGQETLNLGTIFLEGTEGVKTEGTGSFATGRATIGGRQPVDLRDIPQSVTVITEERLNDAGARTIEEAAETVPNLSVALGDPFTASLYSRGHEVFTYNIDGAPRPFLSIYGTAPDLVFFDRIEVLSGPSGVYQGTGEPVGTINLVRKRPTEEAQGRGALSFGSFETYRAEADYSTSLNASGSVRGRVIAFAETEQSFVDFAENEKSGIYATGEIDLTENTLLSFGVITETQDMVRFSGLPSFADGTLLDVSRSTFIGADWNNFETDSVDIFAELRHVFDYGGVLQVTARRYDRDVSIKSLLGNSSVDPVTGDFTTLIFAREYDETSDFFDVNLTSPLDALGVSGEVTIGADYRSTEQVTLQNFDFSAGTQNIFTFNPTTIVEPVITFPGVGPGFRLNTDIDTQEFGLYAQGRFELGSRWKLSLGTRYVSYDSRSVDTGRNVVRSDIGEDRFVSNIGVSYDVNDRLTAYAGFSDIFQPQSEQRASGAQLNPVIGQQVEAGLKGNFADDQLTLQASIFYIQDEDRAIADPAAPGAFLPGGRSESQGIELILNGQLSPNFAIAGGYVFVDTNRIEDPTSPHNLSLWGRYTVPEGRRLAGLQAGLGIRAASSFKSLSTADNVVVRASGYTVLDGMLRFPITDRFSAEMRVENIFDERYYTRVNQTSRGNFYGEPRNISVVLTGRF